MGLTLPTLNGQPARACPKPVKAEKKARTRIRVKAKPKAERDRIVEVRAYVIGRERGRCRCCRFRMGESMHELRPRSIGGKVSKRNSVWVCGDGVKGCHGFLQRKDVTADYGEAGAESVIVFIPQTRQTRDWLKVSGVAFKIESAPMRDYEDHL